MGDRRSRRSITSCTEYRARLRRLIEIAAEDPALESSAAEEVIEEIAVYMVNGGILELDGADNP